jgi:putative heme-binding domain-containing protein
MIYGDQTLFGTSDQLHAFTCEPFHNLVQHNVVSDVGVSFTSTRPEGEGNYDFFASEDRWCRPVMARTGPDGALWIADMYRYMIEHPDWLPPEGKQELLPHYRLGDDRGRIYRIVSTRESARKVQAKWFPTDSIASVVEALDSTNDWQRDKAQQLLVNLNDMSAVPLLERLVRSSARAETRLQALATLDGLGSLNKPLVKLALNDPHPRVRENTIRMIESTTDLELQIEALRLVSDPDDKVCLQLVLTLGEWSSVEAGRALVELAQRYYDEPFVRSAVMSSALRHASVFAEGMSKSSPEAASAFRESIVRQSIGRKDYEALKVLLSNALTDVPDTGTGALDELLLTIQRVGSSLDELAKSDENRALIAPMKSFELLLQQKVKEVDLPSMDASERIDAARLLCRTKEYRSVGIASLSQWLKPQMAPEMQHRVLETYSQCADERVIEVLARTWPELSPELRIRALDVWLSRTAWANDLLSRIEQGLVKIGSLDLGQRDRLLRYPDATIAERSQKLLLGSTISTRKEIVDHYRQALELRSEVGRGKTVYIRACASCHRRENDGHEVGPNLATVTNHTSEKLLINILDPNVDIQPGYQAYNVLLEDGEVLSGLLVGETANSITIKLANGSTRTISRLEIEQLRNSNLSFMPEGLEVTLTQQDLSDLIAFLQSPVVDTKP